MIQEAIALLVERRDLSREQAAEVMRELMEGRATHAQIGALLTALRMKGETVEEITGFAQTMRAFATRVPTARRPLVDTCGTGGDYSNTFNISTAAAFVVAGAGIPVAKHGNRSASSRCGSADVLEALGVNIDAPPEIVGRCIDQAGIGFLFARQLHGAMKHVAGARMELRLRTVFNLLGPLTNPAGACGQVMGVYDANWVEPLARTFLNLGARHVLVVAGSDGLDEMTLAGPTFVAEARNGEVRAYAAHPSNLGFDAADRQALRGGEPAENARILRSVLEGEQGPRRNVVVLNAAAGILVGQAAEDWRDACRIAQQSIDSGAALHALDQLIRVSHAT